ncbi:MAG TPA: TatD family hydrolase, partial [Thermoleophilia bacterium]|nr:TatD family hydrolase [Thermoleophilia bacterium]
LAPVPFRGKENRPAHVTYTAQAIADARGWDTGRVASVTAANARRAFGLTA